MDTIKAVHICSLHVLDRKPTNSNPYPTMNLGYYSVSKVRRIVPSCRKLKYRKFEAATTSESSEPLILNGNGKSRSKKFVEGDQCHWYCQVMLLFQGNIFLTIFTSFLCHYCLIDLYWFC